MRTYARGPPAPQGELRPFDTLINVTVNEPEEVTPMITPEYSKLHNCPICGWRSCPGCDEPPEFDDPYGDEPEALGWTPASIEDHYPVPQDATAHGRTSL